MSELYWAAGFWDGEGCCCVDRCDRRNDYNVGARGGQRRYVRLQIGSTDRVCLERFAAAVGFGNVNGPYDETHRRGNKPMYHWRVTGRRACEILDLLYPLVCQPKRDQFDRVQAEVAEGAIPLSPQESGRRGGLKGGRAGGIASGVSRRAKAAA